MFGFLTAMAPFLISIFGFVLERASASIETKKAFLRLVENMAKDGFVSAKLQKSYEEQRKQLDQPKDTPKNG